MRGLTQHVVASEEDALNMLFIGDTNRAVAETPLNLASSRSHCIFTVSVEGREEGSSVVRHSKLHLVDLAGSERTGKTNSSGLVFREATHINKSLHYLCAMKSFLREHVAAPLILTLLGLPFHRPATCSFRTPAKW